MTCRLCDRPVRSRGLCGRHYAKMARYGDPEAYGPAPEPAPEFKGNGVTLCYNCGKPTRDHSILRRCV